MFDGETTALKNKTIEPSDDHISWSWIQFFTMIQAQVENTNFRIIFDVFKMKTWNSFQRFFPFQTEMSTLCLENENWLDFLVLGMINWFD